MPLSRIRLSGKFKPLHAAAALCFISALRAQTDQPAPGLESATLFRFMNTLPELLNQDLPFLAPGGAYWFYGQPHFGNPFQGKYFRLDAGGWVKVTDALEFNAGAQSYIWRDQGDNNLTRYGFYGMNSGLKYSRSLTSVAGSAIGVGVNYSTPVGSPPLSLTDGWRHTDPYVTYSRPLIPSLVLVGYSTLGVDLLNGSSLPGQFGVNVLHSNSITFSVGASRQWPRFTGSLTLSGATNELVSHEGRQVFTLGPQVFIPVFRGRLPRWHLRVVLGAHATDGPDGRQFGASANLNVNFKSKP